MQPGTFVRGCVASLALAAAAVACHDGTSPPPEVKLAITRPAELSGKVAKAWFESAYGPAGPYAQYDVWVAVSPAPAANAGVVLAKSVPVFLSTRGRITASSGNAIRAGDRVEIWCDLSRPGYGAVQSPPGAPVYSGEQLVIVR